MNRDKAVDVKMGSSQSILSKEDLEAYKQLTYFTEAEIKNCLQRFSELLDPNIPLKSVHDPQANYSSCLFSKDMTLLADFPAVFFHISHWYLSWNTAGGGNCI